MKRDTFANRLKKAMDINNFKQIDVVNKTKLDKTLINKYLNGISEAGSDKLSILSEALQVNEVWLMGYDVPMAKDLSANDFSNLGQYSVDMINNDIVNKYNNLNQLSLKTNIPYDELKKIVNGETKLPKPKYLKAIADALQQDVTEYFIGAGYIETSDYDDDLFNSGIRFLLNKDDRNDLCEILYEIWKKTDNELTKEKIYSNLFDDNKDEYSSKDLINILNKGSNFQFEDMQINDYKLNNSNTFDELEILFDKHKDILTEDDKEYIKFIIEKRKKEIDKELGEE